MSLCSGPSCSFHRLVPTRSPAHACIELLNGGLDKALILVSAPAGYGKTTLLSSWLRETRISSAWLSLDKSDNDPVHFLQYFLSALHQIVPTVGLDLLDMLQGIQPPPYEALLSLVINEIDQQSCPLRARSGRFSRHRGPAHPGDARFPPGAYAATAAPGAADPDRPAFTAFPPARPQPAVGYPSRPVAFYAGRNRSLFERA